MDISYIEVTALLGPPISPLFILSTGVGMWKGVMQLALKGVTFQEYNAMAKEIKRRYGWKMYYYTIQMVTLR